jgi:hypothetical protein
MAVFRAGRPPRSHIERDLSIALSRGFRKASTKRRASAELSTDPAFSFIELQTSVRTRSCDEARKICGDSSSVAINLALTSAGDPPHQQRQRHQQED